MVSSQFLVTFTFMRRILGIIRPIVAKLQKRERDIAMAYEMVDSVIEQIQEVRRNIDEEFKEWYKEAEIMAEAVDVMIVKPRTAARQKHRSNASSGTVADHYRVNLAIPLVDHILEQLQDRFSVENRVAVALLMLLPEMIVSADLDHLEKELNFWNEDLPLPSAFSHELRQWKKYCEKSKDLSKDNLTLTEVFHETDEDCFPNIKQLFRVAVTIPFTSVEAERGFSALRKLEEYCRATMADNRMSALLLVKVHRGLLTKEEITRRYILKHKRRMFERHVLYEYDAPQA